MAPAVPLQQAAWKVAVQKVISPVLPAQPLHHKIPLAAGDSLLHQQRVNPPQLGRLRSHHLHPSQWMLERALHTTLADPCLQLSTWPQTCMISWCWKSSWQLQLKQKLHKQLRAILSMFSLQPLIQHLSRRLPLLLQMGQPVLPLQAVRLHRHSSKQHSSKQHSRQQLAVHRLQVQQLLQRLLLPHSYSAAVLHQLPIMQLLTQLAGLNRASLRASCLVQQTASLHSRQQPSQQVAGLLRASLRASRLVQHAVSLHSRQQHSPHPASRLSLAPQYLPQLLLLSLEKLLDR